MSEKETEVKKEMKVPPKEKPSKRTIVPVGPFHPIQEEPEFFQLVVEGEKVVDADVRISYNHRGIEKISESLTWDQVPYLVARVCGICSASHPFAYVNAVEDLLGIEAPPKAQYIRTIVAELERLHSHLLWFGLAGHFIGYNTVFMWAWRYREPILDLFEKITGNRNHYECYKPGGVRRDIPERHLGEVQRLLDELKPVLDMFINVVIDDPVLNTRLKGIGILTYEDARRYCVTGPTARASGVRQDARKNEPHGAYGWVEWDMVVLEDGDVFSKAAVRLLECVESVKIIRGCLSQMKPGDIEVEIRDFPPGEGIGLYEAPRGEVFHYVRSDGRNCPIRHKIRAPTYVNLPSFKAQVIGAELADAMLIVAAMDPCYSCTERMTVVERRSGQNSTLTQRQLVELSHKKTERIKRKLGR